jgi:hypothetical protein
MNKEQLYCQIKRLIDDAEINLSLTEEEIIAVLENVINYYKD